ncbi:uncharacterized protein FOMMEDRAFT_145668 [Fomitiporia mediterranea MF3/22]|uniref:uncharacterized protein n=1 Tax=Fomitiporia mediterranea (strain MF3/22) TaxID=694068 RepID=UPI00044081CF|nr:uncharacterized protein FOMMEDRAFT_145668 [Fomitiporia mediterranea MF3/22]EJD05008.1 hypothetical protein FOMMEDRAFT_145668 [Fomitiporia mediterranea MF3/22]
MSGSASKLSSQLKAIAQSWPTDPFRPNMQLQTFFLSLSTHPRLTPSSVRAVQELRANELAKKYPLSEKMLKPASRPMHYNQIVEGFQKSAQGIARPWWKRFFEIW